MYKQLTYNVTIPGFHLEERVLQKLPFNLKMHLILKKEEHIEQMKFSFVNILWNLVFTNPQQIVPVFHQFFKPPRYN